jgi:hypothetical protein
MERMTTIRNPGHVLAPKTNDSMHDAVAQASQVFDKGGVSNAAVGAAAKDVDAATLDAAKKAAAEVKASSSLK